MGQGDGESSVGDERKLLVMFCLVSFCLVGETGIKWDIVYSLDFATLLQPDISLSSSFSSDLPLLKKKIEVET